MPKISELNELDTLSANDYFVAAHDLGGLPSTNKIQVYNVANTLTQYLPFASANSSGVVLVGNNLTINSTGYLSSSATISGLPDVNISNGYVLSVTAGGNVFWTAFTGVFNTTTINATNSYSAGLETVIFVNPAEVAQDVTVMLPVNTGVQGKEYTVKNVNAGPYGYSVIVTTDNIGSPYLEDPVTGEFVTSVTMSSTGQGETWVFDGYIYRHNATQRAAPIFYTSANTYHQVVVTNKSSANDASGDLVVYGDTGDYSLGTGPFIDMGIDSSTYSNTQYTLFGPSTAYIYTANANLLIGASSPQTNVTIFTNHDPNVINTNTSYSWVLDYYGNVTTPNTSIYPNMSGPFSGDTDASNNGVPLKGLYYDISGILHIRLS